MHICIILNHFDEHIQNIYNPLSIASTYAFHGKMFKGNRPETNRFDVSLCWKILRRSVQISIIRSKYINRTGKVLLKKMAMVYLYNI